MNTSARKKKTHGTSAVSRTFVVILALLLCLTGLMPLLGAASDGDAEQTVILIDDGKVVPGVKIAGVDVGGDVEEDLVACGARAEGFGDGVGGEEQHTAVTHANPPWGCGG